MSGKCEQQTADDAVPVHPPAYAAWVPSKESDAVAGLPREWRLIVGPPDNKRCAATVWRNGVWHTWDREGAGGENSAEDTVNRAKAEAGYSAISQGFV